MEALANTTIARYAELICHKMQTELCVRFLQLVHQYDCDHWTLLTFMSGYLA